MFTSASRIAVLAAIVVGVIGSGAGRASAATPTKVTRTAGMFKVSLEAFQRFQCLDLPDAGNKSVTATVGTTNIGAGQTFTCASGNEKVTLRYSLVNTYSSDHVSNASHQFTSSYTPDGKSFYNCLTLKKGSNYGGVLTTTIPTQWHDGLVVLGHQTCGGVVVAVVAKWSEAWSAS